MTAVDARTVDEGTGYRTVVDLLTARHVTAAPVVDDTRRVPGVVSQADLPTRGRGHAGGAPVPHPGSTLQHPASPGPTRHPWGLTMAARVRSICRVSASARTPDGRRRALRTRAGWRRFRDGQRGRR
ncbi:CBS domain-containing protein [Micromonospora humidisoli]|uniref:CBS domain-containing protein n=1 Tax=Micromonospora humidisoli TaxID=2807622 RepID=UPI00355923FE